MAGTKLLFFREGEPVDVGEGPTPLSVLIDAEVARLTTLSPGPKLDRSAWIRRAVIRDLRHNRRSRSSHRRKPALPPGASDTRAAA